MLDHVSLGVADLSRSMRFYDVVLAELGYVRLWTRASDAGYGRPEWTDEKFALFEKGADAHPPGPGWHLALTAPSRSAVDRFYAVALAEGGADLGAPGLRPIYGPGYYAAFAADPDGYKLEAVFHEPK